MSKRGSPKLPKDVPKQGMSEKLPPLREAERDAMVMQCGLLDMNKYALPLMKMH